MKPFINNDQNFSRLYRLDNAANLYPVIRGRKRPGVFRVSADLYDSIQPPILQQALDITLKRFPGFSVNLRAGLFWYYFVHSSEQLIIQEDVSNPCKDISSSENNGFLMRVRYHKNRIAVEFFHSVTDGAGAMTFLKTLIAQYLTLLGHQIPHSQDILDCIELPPPEESQDSFRPFAEFSAPRKRQILRAYHIKGSLLPTHSLRTITGIIPIDALQIETRKMGVSITEYLVAAYLFTLNKIQLSEEPRRPLPIKIQVPVNLRHFHKTNTLRNFSAFVMPGIDPAHGIYSFDETLILVHHFMHFEVTEKLLRTQVAENLRTAMNPFIRIMPLFIKKHLIKTIYKYVGPSSFTSTISNLGVVKVPKIMERHVKAFNVTLGATRDTNVSCGLLGYKDNIRICFSRVIEEAHVEREFFTFLVKMGIPIAVESNQE
ncbi:MAG: hypothetical protein Q7J07_05160 [Pelolinea sp.]|nr:hypothetical protein [Pelolinea sp.]